jgi:FtsH-binding integral membrane protein
MVAAFTPLDITKAGGILLACLIGLIVASILGVVIRGKCGPAALD